MWWVGEGVACRTDKQSLIRVEPVHFAVFIVTTISALVATRPLDKNWRPDKQRSMNQPPVWVPRPLGTRGRFILKSLPSCPRATAELIFFSVSSGEQWKTNPDQIYVITFSNDLSTSLAVAVDSKRLSKPHLFVNVSMWKLKFKVITKKKWGNRNFHVKRIRKNGTDF